MKHTFAWLSILLAAGFASSNCVAEDLTVVSNVMTNGHPAGTETDYISADHIRHSQSQGTDMIIDLKTGAMTNIDARKKTYYVMTRQDMQTMQTKMNERMSDPKVKQAMAAMQGMSSSMAASAEVKKTGVTRKVAGYSCEEWLISMGGMMNMTECVTSDFKYPVQTMAALADFNESMRKSMSGFGAGARSGADFAEKMKSIKGFPVATTTTVDAGLMKTTTSSEVTEVSRTPIAASTWEVPAGFTQRDNPMMRSLQQHGR
jgi:Domain of unknown function (DUF4412)